MNLINSNVNKIKDSLIKIRRQFHKYPELSMKEFNTTKLIKQELAKEGIEIIELGSNTGVVCIIHGGY